MININKLSPGSLRTDLLSATSVPVALLESCGKEVRYRYKRRRVEVGRRKGRITGCGTRAVGWVATRLKYVQTCGSLL